MYGLPYREIWCLDTEFRTGPLESRFPECPGHLPSPICLVAKELGSGRVLRLWHDEFGPISPFPVDQHTLYIAFFASAEWGVFRQLGWPLPTRIIDLSAEFRNQFNGVTLPAGRGLIGALIKHGLTGWTTKAEKKGNQDLARRGGPWTPTEQRTLLDYCESDATCLEPLFLRMLPAITAVPHGFSQALIRGRYTCPVAEMEHHGLPTDTETWSRLLDCWNAIKLDVIQAVDADFGVYEGTHFRDGLFLKYLAEHRMAWPRDPDTRQVKTDQDTFADMCKLYPHMHPLKELRQAVSDLNAAKLAIGPDGRNRVLLSPYGQKAGRNNPKSGPFLLGKSVWLRGLIKPAEGRAVACCDWSAQEVHIAAVLSGDQAMLDVLATEDPYLRFAVMAGMAPPAATKASHKEIRDLAKTCVLGNSYGQTPYGLHQKADLHIIEAEHLHRKMRQAFPVFTKWIDQEIDTGYLSGHMTSVLGWRLDTGLQGPNTLRNFPMQSNGAEMLRLAACLAAEWGVEVCAPHHDALWVEADVADIDDAVAATRRAMAEASKVILDGYVIGSEATVKRWPDRWSDARGQVMWDRALEILNGL
jgi:DNA polymerase-1